MNKNKKIILGTLTLALFGALIVGGDIVTAFDGEGFRRYGFERNDVLETAISNNDYNAFIQELQNVGRREVSEITQERFDIIVERYNDSNFNNEGFDHCFENEHGKYRNFETADRLSADRLSADRFL